MEKRIKKNKNWAWGLKAGHVVIYNSRYARVVKAFEKDVEPGRVPLIFTDRKTLPEAFICVPADSIYPFEDRVWKWGPFSAGDEVFYRGEPARIVMAFIRDVPPGHAPIIFFMNRSFADAGELVQATKFVPIDDLDIPKE